MYSGCKKSAIYENGWKGRELFSTADEYTQMSFFRLDTTDEGDSIDAQMPKFCGSTTDKKRFVLLCEDCAKRNGLRW